MEELVGSAVSFRFFVPNRGFSQELVLDTLNPPDRQRLMRYVYIFQKPINSICPCRQNNFERKIWVGDIYTQNLTQHRLTERIHCLQKPSDKPGIGSPGEAGEVFIESYFFSSWIIVKDSPMCNTISALQGNRRWNDLTYFGFLDRFLF